LRAVAERLPGLLRRQRLALLRGNRRALNAEQRSIASAQALSSATGR
jgi:hypothetical protein